MADRRRKVILGPIYCDEDFVVSVHHCCRPQIGEACWWGGAGSTGDLRAERDALTEMLQRVRDLHTPHYEIEGVQHDYVVMLDCFDLPEDHVCRTGEDACRPDMEEHYGLACGECRQNTVDAEPGAPLWPCPTARALDPEEARDG